MRDKPIYVVVGTVYHNNENETLINQEFIECETYEQAKEQSIIFEQQLKSFYPDKHITILINQI